MATEKPHKDPEMARTRGARRKRSRHEVPHMAARRVRQRGERAPARLATPRWNLEPEWLWSAPSFAHPPRQAQRQRREITCGHVARCVQGTADTSARASAKSELRADGRLIQRASGRVCLSEAASHELSTPDEHFTQAARKASPSVATSGGEGMARPLLAAWLHGWHKRHALASGCRGPPLRALCARRSQPLNGERARARSTSAPPEARASACAHIGMGSSPEAREARAIC